MEIHSQVLTLRNLENLISKTSFHRLYESSSPEEKKQIYDIIQNGNKEEVARWMITHPDLEPGEMSLKGLRLLAARLHIVNYSRKSKLELIQALQSKENLLCQKQNKK